MGFIVRGMCCEAGLAEGGRDFLFLGLYRWAGMESTDL